MNIKKRPFILTYFLCLFLLLSMPAYAQNTAKDDDVKSLGDILNPPLPDDVINAVTVRDMANIYYRKCMNTESLAFDDQEKEILCACTSANIGQVITVSEFNNMYEKNARGKDARGKVIAYAYTGCMEYVVKRKLYNDCMVSPVLKSIIQGKKTICECSSKRYLDVIAQSTSYIIMEAIKYEPMTLNPLEFYFTRLNYKYQADRYTDTCRYKFLYEQQ